MRSVAGLARVGQARFMSQAAPRAAGNFVKPTFLKGAAPQASTGARSLFASSRVLGGVLPSRLSVYGIQGAAPVAEKKPLQEAVATMVAPAKITEQAVAATGAQQEAAGAAVGSLQSNGMVFEIGLSFLVSHYVHMFQSLCRCLFQVFRPIFIAFIFGQILKAVFFAAGLPVWFSFYSIWMFEVFYGLAQCVISFIFVCFFYNNLSYQRIRPLFYTLRTQGRTGLETALRVARQAQQEKSPIARVMPYLKPTA